MFFTSFYVLLASPTQLYLLWLVSSASVTPNQRGFPTIDVANVRDLPIMPKARRVSGGKKSPIDVRSDNMIGPVELAWYTYHPRACPLQGVG